MNKREAAYRVFGEAFSFEKGFDSAREEEYRKERSFALNALTGIVWVARNMDSDIGIAADLYVRGVPTLLLDHEYSNGLTDVYESPVRGLHEGKMIFEQMPFEEAVERAEEYVAPRVEIANRNNQG